MKLWKFLVKTIALTSLVGVSALSDNKFVPSDNKNLAVLYTFDKPNDDAFEHFVTEDLAEIGFFKNDPHHRVNDVYKEHFGKTNLDLIGFTSMFSDSVSRPLLNKDPRLGGFALFNLLNYRKKSDMKTTIAHLTPEAMLDILQIEDKEVREKFIAGFEPYDALIKEKLGGTKSYVPVKGYAKQTMMNFEIPFEEPEDIDDFLDEFQETYEMAFEEKGYIIAGFYNVKDSFNTEDEEDAMPDYASYWIFDLCHIPFSYAIFDGDAGEPLPTAGVFAPCSMYMYVREGENKFVIGMPTLGAWAAALGITDDDKLRFIDRLDTEIPEIIESLGGVRTTNVNPLAAK